MTASGRPSGTATTSTVMPMMKNLTKFSMYTMFHGSPLIPNVVMQKRRMRMRKVSMAIPVPVISIQSKVKVTVKVEATWSSYWLCSVCSVGQGH